MKAETVQQQNTRKREALKLQNYITTITGRLTKELDFDGTTIYGLEDVLYWNTSQQRWISLSEDPDKFKVSHESFEIAQQEFWTRWHLYVRNRFGRHIPLELK